MSWKLSTHFNRSDSTGARSLHHFVGGFPFLTVQSCLDQCESLGFGLAGLEFIHACCGYLIPPYPPFKLITSPFLVCGNALLFDYGCSDNCSAACSGNSTQICGGPNALSIYETGKVTFTEGPAAILPGYKNWEFTQCWQ